MKRIIDYTKKLSEHIKAGHLNTFMTIATKPTPSGTAIIAKSIELLPIKVKTEEKVEVKLLQTSVKAKPSKVINNVLKSGILSITKPPNLYF